MNHLDKVQEVINRELIRLIAQNYKDNKVHVKNLKGALKQIKKIKKKRR